MSRKNNTAPAFETKANDSILKISVAQEEKPTAKTLEDHQREFDRLSDLFNRKKRFEKSLGNLSLFLEKLQEEDSSNLESEDFKLVLSYGFNRDDIKLNNREVIEETISYLKSKIALTIEAIEAQILEC